MEKAKALTILNSKFINLTANISSGAIGVKTGGVVYIRNCEFINVSSAKNAGAILVDILGMDSSRPGNVTILDTVFRNTSSGYRIHKRSCHIQWRISLHIICRLC